MKDYCNLHTHTTFSLMHSLIKPAELFKHVKSLGQTSVAVSDYGTMAGAWDLLKYSKAADVKLIMGCEFYFTEDLNDTNQRLRHVVLLAKNHEGYKNLLLANKLANDNNIILFKKAVPRIDWKILEDCSSGLICLTACGSGILGQLINNRKSDQAKIEAKRLKDIFGDNLGLEIQTHTLKRNTNSYNDYEDQSLVNNTIIKFGKELDIKVVATPNSHYVTRDQADAHDVMLAIAAGQPVRSGARLKFNIDNCNGEFYLKSREEVVNFFSRLYPKQAEEFCDNSLYFSEMCEHPEWIDPKYSNPSGKELPVFPVMGEKNYPEFINDKQNVIDSVPDKNLKEDALYLRWLCNKRFYEFYESGKIPTDKVDEYKARIEEELDVMEFHGFSSYMLIVADYVAWAKNHDIPVGPGRGSVGGCLLAYLLNIHEADPIKYGLIFSRFHNKEKKNFPDVDLDIATSGRQLVLDYINDKYGKDNVAHVSNISTMTPKVFARDIARAFEYGGDRKTAVAIGTIIADAIPAESKTMDDAFEKSGYLSELATKYTELNKYANQLSGKAKVWSTHAAGLIIGNRALHTIVPVRKDKDGNTALEYEKERAEENGLVKMDLLGLETLDIIKNTYKIIKDCGKPTPTFNMEYYDKEAYDIICDGNVFGVFQLGTSSGTRDLCVKIKPQSISDISLINALARPSAAEMRSDFIATKNGEKAFELLDPRLERSFKQTYGFGLYEECLMYVAHDIAGWDLHKADNLRKLTKGKGKYPEKDAKLRLDFISDSVKNGVNEDIATRIWDEVIEGFSGYGFNKSVSHNTLINIYDSEGHFLSSKPISDIDSGYVKSRDEVSGNDIFVRVRDRHDHGVKPVVEVELITGEKIQCTMDHKFRVEETGEMLPLWKIIQDGLSIVVNTAHTTQE